MRLSKSLSPPPLPRSDEPIMSLQREPAKLSPRQRRDSRPRPSGRSVGEPAPQTAGPPRLAMLFFFTLAFSRPAPARPLMNRSPGRRPPRSLITVSGPVVTGDGARCPVSLSSSLPFAVSYGGSAERQHLPSALLCHAPLAIRI